MDAIRGAWHTWDANCAGAVRGGLATLGLTELLHEPSSVSAHFPFVRSPTPLVTAILAYLAVVAYGRLIRRPQPPGSKESAAWRMAVQGHNLGLVALSSYMFLRIIYEARKNGYSLWGPAFNVKEVGMARVIYVFYMSKWWEFLDTVIMVVKGNVRQVTFLHVYHHLSISVIWWAISYVAPGGDAYFPAALNSLVHVVMYTYYFLASTIKDRSKRSQYLWWGRYVTMFQIAQFGMMLIQSIYCIATNSYNMFLSKLFFYYMLTLLTLFGNFFYRKYIKGRPAKAKAY